MNRSQLRSHSSPFAPIFVGGVYFALATAALIFTRFEGGLAFIWAANAYLMAELLTSRTACWPRAIFACVIASCVATGLFGLGPVAAIPMALVNVAESLIVAAICRHYLSDRPVTNSTQPLVIFILALCGVADVVTGIAAASIASGFSPVGFGASFLQYYTGHALGGLTCTPILVLVMQGEIRRWMHETQTAQKVEAAMLLVFFTIVTMHIFYMAHYPMLFAAMLPLVLIAFRVGYIGAAASVLILAVVGGTATLSGTGPLMILDATQGERVQAFQFYLAICFLLSMPVAAELNGRRKLFQLLRESEARYRAIAEHNGDVVLNISVEGTIQYASPAASEQIGCAPELLVGQLAANLVDPDNRAEVVDAHNRALAHPGQVHKVEFRPLVAVDDLAWCEMVSRAVIDERGETIGVVSTIRDMSRHKAQQQALEQVASCDALTGADSRRAFLDKLDVEMRRARSGARSSLLMIDIDHFKAVNDSYGHGAGDRVLSAFVERLRPGLRGKDSIGRLGGEEFAILLIDSDIDRASMICERLRARMADPISLDTGESIRVTFSAGLVELDGASARSTMLESADKALYRAKHSGRNCLRLAA